MSSKKLSQLFSLPFLKSYNTGSRRFITIAKVQTFLGLKFYDRLSNIYNNLVEAIATKNYRYLSSSFETDLAQKIFAQLKGAEDGRYKFKINSPNTKLVTANRRKKQRRILRIRQNIWDNQITRIGVQCNVYFGEKFDREDPLKKKQGVETPSLMYRVGQFRYLRYYPHLGLFGNVKNMYNHQTYEILVKYASKMYLEVQNYDEVTSIGSNTGNSDHKSEEIITEMTFRTSDDKFDWVITDINNLNKDSTTKK